MKTITLSLYIKTIRKYSKNCRKSYQNILSNLFNFIYNDNNYFVESTTSSRIMNGEYDVPYDVREKYNNESMENKKKISDKFINQMIDESAMGKLVDEMKGNVKLSDISMQTKKLILNSDDALLILSSILTIAIISSNKKALNQCLYKNNNGSIDLICGDIIALGFNKKLTISNKIVVIPVDDKFTMILKNQDGEDFISKDSIHGKWISRINKLGIEDLKIKYFKSIDNVKIGKCEIGKTFFYLLPISSLKERNKAESNVDVIKKSLDFLATEYNVSGQGIPMYIPLLGTGRSRAHLSLKDSISLIKNAFLTNENGFFGEIKIVIYTKNIDELEDYNGL